MHMRGPRSPTTLGCICLWGAVICFVFMSNLIEIVL